MLVEPVEYLNRSLFQHIDDYVRIQHVKKHLQFLPLALVLSCPLWQKIIRHCRTIEEKAIPNTINGRQHPVPADFANKYAIQDNSMRSVLPTAHAALFKVLRVTDELVRSRSLSSDDRLVFMLSAILVLEMPSAFIF